MRIFWMFVLLCLGMCSACSTVKPGDLRLVDEQVCVKGTKAIKKRHHNYYRSETTCTKYVTQCQLQVRTIDGRWEYIIGANVPCSEAPKLNIEAEEDFDYTKPPKETITEN